MLVVGRDHATLLGLMMSSQERHAADRDWVDATQALALLASDDWNGARAAAQTLDARRSPLALPVQLRVAAAALARRDNATVDTMVGELVRGTLTPPVRAWVLTRPLPSVPTDRSSACRSVISPLRWHADCILRIPLNETSQPFPSSPRSPAHVAGFCGFGVESGGGTIPAASRRVRFRSRPRVQLSRGGGRWRPDTA